MLAPEESPSSTHPISQLLQVSFLSTLNSNPLSALAAGDPTLLGWTTFALYIVTAGLCALRTHRDRAHPERMPRTWRLLAAGLLVLGINKQLDFQTVIRNLGRKLALAEGWYAYRRLVQLVFFLTFILALIASCALYYRMLMRFIQQYRLSAVGCSLVALYVLIRIASFEHADHIIGFNMQSWPGLAAIEVSGLLLITWERFHVGAG